MRKTNKNNISSIQTNNASYSTLLINAKKYYKKLIQNTARSLNLALIEFYWNLGGEISAIGQKQKTDSFFYHQLSLDLKSFIVENTGISPSTIKYTRYFYELYSPLSGKLSLPKTKRNRLLFLAEISKVPWGHHMVIIDKCHNDLGKAMFYVQRTIQNGWTRSLLLNHTSL